MFNTRRCKRKGNVVVMIAVLMPVLAGLGAFAIDVGYIAYLRAHLQAGADAAALAAAEELGESQATLDAVALRYATLNDLSGGDLEVTVEGGTWNQDTGTFTPTDLTEADSVRVSIQRPDSTLHFGALLGKSSTSVSASAVATKSVGVGGRFLIDDEMIDTDVPAIQNLASSTGKTSTQLLTPRGFNQGKQYGASNWTWTDNFLDLPSGATLNLPTGQGTDYNNNDAGLFDIDHPAFPFTDDATYMQFLMFSESGNDPTKWGTHYSNIYNQLDPLTGVAPVTNGNNYPSYVSANYVHVSPVTFSDISTLNMQDGVPRINAKGLRRGLIAFKIIGVGNDIDGGGSVLPELVLKIVDPATINPNDIRPYAKREVKLVQ